VYGLYGALNRVASVKMCLVVTEEVPMNIAEISKMSVLERLQTMEALWDSLSHEPSEMKSPKWHEDILSDRKEKIANGNANFISLEELKLKHEK